MIDVKMPRLSDSMEEGTVLRWLIADGQTVAVGDELVEIETDKATMTYVSEVEGVLQIVATEGTTLPVDAPIARVGANASTERSVAQADVPPSDVPRADAARPDAARPDAARPDAARPDAARSGPPAPPRATPLARRAAKIHRVVLDGLTGSGPRGRITRDDVLSAAGAAPSAEQPRPARPSAPASDAREPRASSPATIEAGDGGAKGATQRIEASRLQGVIARRMAEAKATIPDFQLQTEVTMDAAIALRAELKAIAAGESAPSFNDFVIKACAVALCDHPRVNSSYVGGAFELYERVNIGVAVAASDALVVPVVRDADTKPLTEIGRGVRRAAERVRSGEVTPPELAGATFTVSNLGMYEMTAITPVVNPPQAAILGVGAMRATLARVDGEIVDRTLMTITLSCDHRILYGAEAAQFLADVKRLLEEPLRLAL
jgi:pyruvate dehydrogenase E2 component (dihydrolipoamide acetyltransferase)